MGVNSRFSLVRLFTIPWTLACQPPLSMGILQARYQRGLPYPIPGDLLDPGIELTSLMSSVLAGGFLTTSITWEALKMKVLNKNCKFHIVHQVHNSGTPRKKTGLTIPICCPNISKEIDIKVPNLEICESESGSCSVVSDSLWLHGLYSLWNSPGWNTGVGSHSLLQGIFPTQGSNPDLHHCRLILYQLSHKGSPRVLE